MSSEFEVEARCEEWQQRHRFHRGTRREHCFFDEPPVGHRQAVGETLLDGVCARCGGAAGCAWGLPEVHQRRLTEGASRRFSEHDTDSGLPERQPVAVGSAGKGGRPPRGIDHEASGELVVGVEDDSVTVAPRMQRFEHVRSHPRYTAAQR